MKMIQNNNLRCNPKRCFHFELAPSHRAKTNVIRAEVKKEININISPRKLLLMVKYEENFLEKH